MESLLPDGEDLVALKIAEIIVRYVSEDLSVVQVLDRPWWEASSSKDGCYPIGPYKATKAYVLACYDIHAPTSDIDLGLFRHTFLEDVVQKLRNKKATITSVVVEDEPFVLVHGDFHGRNIIMQCSRVQAVLD